MSYSLTFVANLGSSQTGLTLNAKLYDTAGAQTGATITSGFVEIGNGVYEYTATIPAAHRGTFVMYKSTDATINAAFSVNPQEAEYNESTATLTAAVWAYTTRTLTQTAASVAAAISGSSLAITIGITYTCQFTGLTIPVTWSKIYVSGKQDPAQSENNALFRVQKSIATTDDGLQRIQMAAASNAAWGSLTVDQGAGTITFTLADDATALLLPAAGAYDIKCILDDGTSQLLSGPALFVVSATPSFAVS